MHFIIVKGIDEFYPYRVVVKMQTLEVSVKNWCNKSIGGQGNTWQAFALSAGRLEFRFVKAESAVLFKLKFG